MIMFAIGFAGLLMAYQSTRYAYKPRSAFMWLLTGTMLLVVAYIYTEFIILAKLTTTDRSFGLVATEDKCSNKDAVASFFLPRSIFHA